MTKTAEKPFEYCECLWGDLIIGTKAQFQSLGIGLRSAFPGEPGAPRRLVRVIDPRGFPAEISPWCGDGRFEARIPFPAWPRPRDPSCIQIAVAPGVVKTRRTLFDRYLGTPAALIAAGIVRVDQIPGPGKARLKTARWLPDGRLCAPGQTGWSAPGGLSVHLISLSRMDVLISVTDRERESREAEVKKAHAQWEREVTALPRPAKLEPLPQWRLTRLAEAADAPLQSDCEVIDLCAWKASRYVERGHLQRRGRGGLAGTPK